MARMRVEPVHDRAIDLVRARLRGVVAAHGVLIGPRDRNDPEIVVVVKLAPDAAAASPTADLPRSVTVGPEHLENAEPQTFAIEYEVEEPPWPLVGGSEARDAADLAPTFQAGGAVCDALGYPQGTGGAVLSFGDDSICIVTNEHVARAAGGRFLFDGDRNTLAEFLVRREPTDTAWAEIEEDVQWSSSIPDIGRPTKVIGGIQWNWRGRKYGARTRLTEFVTRRYGFVSGAPGFTEKSWECWDDNYGLVGAKGDSGSVVIGNQGELMGLMWGGADPGGATPDFGRKLFFVPSDRCIWGAKVV
jgi:hypothetical protein